MFGIEFDGHPNLVPLLLPDGFEGHPLRKDFVLAARAAKAWPGAKEPGESERRRAAEPAQDCSRPASRTRQCGARARPGEQPERRSTESTVSGCSRSASGWSLVLGAFLHAAAARRADRAQGDGAHAGRGSARCTPAASTAGRSSSPTA